jgi:hypothetical protein
VFFESKAVPWLGTSLLRELINLWSVVTHPFGAEVRSRRRKVKHGLIEKTMSIPDAYKVFLKVGVTQRYRNSVAR